MLKTALRFIIYGNILKISKYILFITYSQDQCVFQVYHKFTI